MIELKYLVGGVETPFYNIQLKDFSHSSEFMAESVITAEISLLDDISDDEWLSSFLTFGGETWRCFVPPARKKGSAQLEYIYTLTYKPESEVLKGVKFLDRVSTLPKLTTGLSVVVYSGGITEFADRLTANLARIGGWNVYVEAGLNDEPRDITIDNQYIWDALTTISDEYKYKYTIKGKKIYIWNTVGYVFADTFKVGDTISHEFQYGKGNGLYEINKSATEDKVLGYVRGSGSERNIPLNYYRDSDRFAANPCPDYAPALMPKIYTQGDATAIPPIAPWTVDYYKNDAEIAKGNITEEFVRFDGTDGNEEIYPTIKGVTYEGNPIDELLTVGEIGSDEISDTGKVIDDEFDVSLNPLGFNLSKCISAKGEMIMNMQSGMCSGANFKVVAINGKRTNGVNTAKNYYFFPKLVLDEAYWWGNHSEDVVLGFYGQGQGEQTLAYTKEMKWGEGSILRNDSTTIGDGVNVTLTPIMKDRYSDNEIVLTGGGTWPLLYGSSVNLEGVVAIAEQEVKDDSLGYLPAGMWDLVMRISYTTIGTEDIIGGGYLYLPFDKDTPYMTDKGTIVFPDSIQESSITLTLQKSLGDYDILVPNATLYPEAGDKFVFLNIDLPDAYVIAAEERLEAALKAYRDSHAYNKFNYDISIDSKFVNDNPSIASLLRAGNRLKIGSEALNILNVSTEYKKDSIFPNYTVRVSPTTQRIVSNKKATAEKANKTTTETAMLVKALTATNRDSLNRMVALEVRASGINAGAEPQDRVEIYPNYSNGANQIPAITDNGDGTITIGAGQYNLSSNASGAGLINLYTIVGGTFSLTNDAQNYVVANYNGGSPIVEVITNVTLINETTIVPIYSIYRNGNILHTQNWDALGLALANKVHQSIVKTQRYRRESGLSLTEYGTRSLRLTQGRIWTGAVPVDLSLIETATDNLAFWFKTAGVWGRTLSPSYNNTYYCDGTNLVELTANRYAVNWVFRGVESQKHLYVVAGSGDYTLTQAQSAVVPPLPVAISSHAVLVAKITVQKGAATATSIQSAFDAQFSYSSPSAHNDLTGIQGGAAAEYYHLTSAQHTIATQSATAARNGYLLNTDWSRLDTAYTDRLKWNGEASGLNAITGRESLGLRIGVDVLAYRTFGTAANNNTGDFLAYNGTAVDSSKLGGQLPAYYQVNIVGGLSTDYYTGSKTWADLSSAVRGVSLLGYSVGANTALAASDTILGAFGKVQGQINARALSTDLTAHINNTSPHLSVSEREYFNKLFTYLKFAADNTSMYSTLNFYSESGVSAFGIGTGGGGGGSVDIIDNLVSTRIDAALSANQGRILNGYIALKQPQLNGTGLVRMSGTGVSYDNSSYLTTTGVAYDSSRLGNVLAANYFRKDETYLMGKYVLESIPKETTQVGSFGWDDYQTTPYAGGMFLTLRGNSSLRSLLMIFPDYSNQDNIKILTSIDGAAWGQQKELAWKDHTHSYLPLSGGKLTNQLIIEATTYNNFNEGLRINLATNGYAGIVLGDIVGSTGGCSADAWFLRRGASKSFAILPAGDDLATGLELIKGGDAKWRSNTILHSGNYSSYALPLSGGAINSTASNPFSVSISGKKILDIINSEAFFYAEDNAVARWASYYNYAVNQIRFYSKNASGADSAVTLSIYDGSAYRNVIHSGNIGSQSVNYAASAGNADTLDGYDQSAFAKTGHDHSHFYTKYSYPNNIVQSTTAETLSGTGQNITAMFDSPSIWGGYANAFVYTGYNQYGSTQIITRYNATNNDNAIAFRVYNQVIGGYNNWTEIWTKDNLTNTLSSGYLPYWNGSSLVNSGVYMSESRFFFKYSDILPVLRFGELSGIMGVYSSGQLGIRANGGLKLAGGDVDVNLNPHLMIAANGYVGISTNSPFERLTIGNTILQDSVLGFEALVSQADSRRWRIANDRVYYGDFAIMSSTTNSSTTFEMRFHIKNNGNIGIGYTDRSEKLAVNGELFALNGLKTQGGYRIYDSTTSLGGLYPYKIVIGSGADNSLGLFSEGEVFFASGGTATKRGVFFGNGNFHLGYTTDQGYKFAVGGTGYFNSDLIVNGQGSFNNINVATSTGITLREAGYGYWNINTVYEWSNPDLIFSANGTRRFRVSAAGNFDIGYTDGFNNNVYKLNVNGSGYFKEGVTANLFQSIHSFWGGVFKGSTGSYSDFAILTPSDSYVMYVPVGTRSMEVYGYIKSNAEIVASTYLKAPSIKIGDNWEAIPNGTTLELRYGGVMKAKLDPSGNILAVGNVTAFAV